VAVGNYIIFYRVANDVVSIIRVLHGARNITAALFSQ
jgi:plasmid stabilization system protein ParE